jgi:hypothetical protein
LKTGRALEGPDTDALKGNLRDNGGQGVHFSGPGLRENAARWVEKVAQRLKMSWNRPTRIRFNVSTKIRFSSVRDDARLQDSHR